MSSFFDRYRPITFTLFYVLSPLLLISNYAYSLPKLPKEGGLRWFFALNNGVVTCNFVDYYYIITNAVRLMIVMISVACFLSVAVEVFRMGSVLKDKKASDPLVTLIGERMRIFSAIYVLMKLYAALAMLHLLVWSSSPLAVRLNVALSTITLMILAAYLLAVPRHYIEIDIRTAQKQEPS